MSKVNLIVSLVLVVVIVILAANILIQFRSGVTSFYTATTTGTADVNVSVAAAVSVIIKSGSQVTLGSLNPGDSNTSESGTGVILENNGTVDVNITATSDTTLFSSSNMPAWEAAKIKCKAAASSGGSAAFWQSTYTNCYNGTAPKIIGCLTYANATDEARVDLNVTVPLDEPSGAKHGQVTFTASAC